MSDSSAPSPLLNRWLPTILLILAALGVPAAAIGFFTHLVTTQPLLATIVGVLYEVVLFTLSFIGKVWGKLESRWVDRIADWVDHLVLSTFSQYHKQYCDYLGYQHRDFDVKGLSLQGTYTLELDQVFIELSIDPTTLQDMSANPIPIPQALAEGSHSIWDYLSSVPLANQHLVLVGPPGSGKTTLLKHITLTLLTHRKHHLHDVIIPHKLPVLIFLRDHANSIHISESKETPDFTLVEALCDHLKKWEQPDPPVGWIQHQLVRGRCLIMLDGLDEVADPQVRKEVVNWVQKQMVAYRDNRFVVTSRPFGFRNNPLSGVAMLEVRPFTPQQVERFIHKWYLADEIMRKRKDDPGVQMRARAEAKSLLQQLYDTPALLNLTVNPLLLTMIAIVHRYGGGGRLPEKRVSLYEDICKVFLGKRQEARGQNLQLKPDQSQLVLQPLAYFMMVKGLRKITLVEAIPIIEQSLQRVSSQLSSETFLRFVEDVSGLILERESDVYEFAHKTFQEYLTATYIRDKQLDQQLVILIGDVWWQETLRLYCAMADATPIISACLADDHPSALTLVLALDCQKEARELKPEVKSHLEHILYQGMEDTDEERQHIVAEVMLARRLQQMTMLGENTFIDTSLVTCGEYQLFLDEQRKQGKYYQPDHWQDYRFLPGQGFVPILGVRSSDAAAFCEWLTDREASPWLYRLPKIDEHKQIDRSSVFSTFPTFTGCWLEKGRGFVWANESLSMSINVVREMIVRDLVRDSDLARNFALVRNLTLADTRDHYNRDLALDLILTLIRTLTHILTRVRNFVLDLNPVLADTSDYYNRDLDLDLGIALIRTLTRILTRALDFDQAISLALGHAIDLALDLDFDLALDRIIAFDPKVAISRVISRTISRFFARLLIRDRSLASDRSLANALDLDRVISPVLDRSIHRDRSLARTSVLEYVLNLNYLIILERLRPLSPFWWQQLLNAHDAEQQHQYLIDPYLDIYIMLVVLEGRMQGRLPACEGILIVKEKKI